MAEAATTRATATVAMTGMVAGVVTGVVAGDAGVVEGVVMGVVGGDAGVVAGVVTGAEVGDAGAGAGDAGAGAGDAEVGAGDAGAGAGDAGAVTRASFYEHMILSGYTGHPCAVSTSNTKVRCCWPRRRQLEASEPDKGLVPMIPRYPDSFTDMGIAAQQCAGWDPRHKGPLSDPSGARTVGEGRSAGLMSLHSPFVL